MSSHLELFELPVFKNNDSCDFSFHEERPQGLERKRAEWYHHVANIKMPSFAIKQLAVDKEDADLSPALPRENAGVLAWTY